MSIDLELNGTLSGISGNFIIEETEILSNVSVLLQMTGPAFEDIPVECAWCKDVFGYFPIEFSLLRPNYYNFEDIGAVFEVVSGESLDTEMPIMFSLVRSSVDYVSYILQKTYSVMTELNGKTDLVLADWNVYPNQLWYILVNGLEVTLYETENDVLNETNPIATGTADALSFETILYYLDEEDEYADTEMEHYYEDLDFHLVLSANITSGKRYFCMKPFSDIEEIQHQIYNNSNITLSRGEAELNLHTYTVLPRELELGVHIPEMDIGDVVDFTSTRRNVSQKSQILSQTISGEMNDNGEASLINTITVANYMELFRR
ncbi:MAG: hypothetical protein WC346_00150 [Methanogenium sp.]|jgi:hypothetical protein